MFVELQDPATRDATYETHRRMTVLALRIIFEQPAEKAEMAVQGLWKRYAEAAVSTRDRLVHEDPLNLAAELAEMPWPTDPREADPQKTIADLPKLTEEVEHPERPRTPWIDLIREPFRSRVRKYNAEVRADFEKMGLEASGKRAKTPFERSMLGG
jgi:hypothetical protein